MLISHKTTLNTLDMEIKISSLFKKYSELKEKEEINDKMGILDFMLKGKVSLLETVLMNCDQRLKIEDKDCGLVDAIFKS